jgi:hypothetical protein
MPTARHFFQECFMNAGKRLVRATRLSMLATALLDIALQQLFQDGLHLQQQGKSTCQAAPAKPISAAKFVHPLVLLQPGIWNGRPHPVNSPVGVGSQAPLNQAVDCL